MKKSHILTAPLLTILLTASPAFAVDGVSQDKELSALRAQIAELVKKVENLEAQAKQNAAQTVPAKTGASSDNGDNLVLAKGSFPGSIKIPGTDTSVKLNGYVKLDVITDVGGTSGGLEYNKFSTIPLDRSAKSELNEETRFNARQSRVGFETRTPTDYGELKTYVEGDFYGATASSRYLTNGDGFELRHAYGSLGPVLAGQTWSNFMDPDSMAESMDYGGPAGLIFIRQGQVRYTHNMGDWTVSGSIENPQGDFFSSSNTSTVTYDSPLSQMPDIVARADYKFDTGYTSVRALVRQINAATYSGASGYAGGSVSSTNITAADTEYGYALAISGRQKIYKGANDSFNYQIAAGDGIGRYLYDLGLPNTGDSYINRNLETQFAYGGYAGYQHVWSPHWRTNVFGGFTKVNNSDALKAATDSSQIVNKVVATGHLNLVWQPVPSFKVGTEYMHAYRQHKSGADGNLDRVQTSFIYSF